MKALMEGMAVVIAAFYLNKKVKLMDVVSLGLVATATFMLLDYYAPNVATGARLGSGFAIGSNLVGGSTFSPIGVLAPTDDVKDCMSQCEDCKYTTNSSIPGSELDNKAIYTCSTPQSAACAMDLSSDMEFVGKHYMKFNPSASNFPEKSYAVKKANKCGAITAGP